MNACSFVLLTIAAISVSACDYEALDVDRRRSPRGQSSADVENDAGAAALDPARCGGKVYTDFDGKSLVAQRIQALPNVDRGRIKPYGALAGEYARVLGKVPESLAGAASTYGPAPERWYEEPQASGITVLSAFEVAFDGCLGHTETDAKYAAMPEPSTAAAECTAMARKFWSRMPSPSEVDACVAVATTGTASEPQARRKWAYACAATLTASGFLTY